MRTISTAVVAAALALLATTATPAAAATDTVNRTLVVDGAADGDDDYPAIGAALADAADGDRIRVEPGVYRESIVVDREVRLVAPEGATLRPDEGPALTLDAAATVDGFTVAGAVTGVDARGTTGDWTLRNTTIRDVDGGFAVMAAGTSGDWTLRNVTVENASQGVVASRTSGDWTVRDTRVVGVSRGHGVDAARADGNWILRNVTVEDVGLVGVLAVDTGGNWRMVGSTVDGATVGVGARNASGDWAVRRSTLANATDGGRYDLVRPALVEGIGVAARNTSGDWRVLRTRFVGNERGAIDATGAAPAGDATRNWWGASSGPAAADCTGAVDCGEPLTAWPPATPTPTGTAQTPTPTGTPAGRPTGTATGGQPGFGLLAVAAAVGLLAPVRRLRGDGAP